MMNKFRKVTHGWVSQFFTRGDGNKFHCTEQSFFTGDPCQYEDCEFGDELVSIAIEEAQAGEIYQPFDMIQPIMVYHNLIVVGDVEPELSEPFENWDDMVSAAEQHREKEKIFHLTVPKGVRVEIDTYCGK